jgi:nucleotide-binding universal stress UspA family protein
MDYKLRTGKIYSEVVAFAQSKKADLIVTGSHGVSGFEEYWIGSNANRIVAHAGCPVITVRNKYAIKDSGWKIVLPLDNSNQTLGKLEISTKLAKLIGAEIHLVTIYSTSLKTMHKRVDSFAEKAMKYFEKENVHFVREHFDLIAIMTEQESNTSSGIIGPNAQQIVNHSPIPVLSVHPSDAGKF